MIAATLFYFIEALLGYLLVKRIAPNLNIYLSLGLSFTLGSGLLVFLLFILSVCGLPLNSLAIVIVSLASVFLSLILSLKRVPCMLKDLREITDTVVAKYTFLEILLFAAASVLLLSVLFQAVTTAFNMNDEFSYWGVAAYRIFSSGTVNLKNIIFTDFEKYPLYLPINAAIPSILRGYFSENFSRMATFITLPFLLLLMFGAIKDLGLKYKENILFMILIVTSGRIFTRFSGILYADSPFAYFYTAATTVFALSLNVKDLKQKRRLYFLSGLLFSLTTWVKVEGLMIVAATIAFGLLVELVGKRSEQIYDTIKNFLYIVVPAVFIPLIWILYGNLANLGQSGWTTKLFANTEFAMSNLGTILDSMRILAFSLPLYSGFWLLASVALVVGLVFFWKDKRVLFLSGIILLNVSYLLATYLFVMGSAESLRAASFDRYIIHFLPIAVYLMAVVYSRYKQELLSE